MRKYNCTATPNSTTYFVTVVADEEQHAIEIARVKAKQEWGSKVAGGTWRCQYVDSGYSSPARVLDYGTI
jgi:hypothetical protein